jgi:two-component system, OmpR family, heavy metal sensor histidine kinase CusS
MGMSNGLSIRAQLTIWYTVVLAVGLALFSFLVWFGLGRILRVDLADNLTNKARGFEEYLHIEEKDPDINLVKEIAEYSQSWLEDHLLALYDSSGTLIYSNIGADFSTLKQHVFRDSEDIQAVGWKHRPYLGLSRPIMLSKGRFRTFLAVSMQSDERALRALGWLLASAVPIFVACAAGGGLWLSGKALKPVDRITERARHIGIRNLSERLAVPHTKDELQRLTETWNGMLERLEASVKKISQFTGDASHELRTPLAIIRLAAENALRKSRSEEEYHAALQHIQRESEKMTDLITDLLFLARDEVDTEHERCNVNLAELIRDVGSDFSVLASTKEVALKQDLVDMPVAVYGSAPSLRRLIVILLDNAIKYTPKGGSVVVRLQRRNSEALIEVEDTGIGIPEELKSHVFERFFRADPSRNKETGGYGLGLAIARAIVLQHNAKIEIRANCPAGSIFCVLLPLV